MCKCLRSFFVTIRSWFDAVIDFIFSLYWDRKKRPIPDLDKKHAFLAESATTLARKIREKELTSEELVSACIARMKLVNPLINAIVDERYEQALQEAREIDKRLAAGEITPEEFNVKPYLGVPFTGKECHPVTGLCYTLGLKSRRNERATEDAECIKLLKGAGAIPLAVSNLPEFLIWQETRNMVFGQTNNPHHLGRSPGGSSGGEAAMAASYATTISLCSDIGGSTRMPAFYCGLFGHNPTPGVTKIKGMLYRNGDEDSMLALGFIAKHAEDLAPLTKIICGDRANQLNLDRSVDIKDIKFYYLEESDDLHCSRMKADVKEAMEKVVTKLKQECKGHSPEPYNHEGFNHMYTLWRYWMTKEPEDFAKWLKNNKGKASGLGELFKKMFCMSDHTMAAIFKLLDKQVLPQVNAQWAEDITNKLKNDLFKLLGDNGVLLFPSAPQVAPYHYSCFLRPYNFGYWAVLNALRCPATQVPLGVNNAGLPVGIQVVASPYNDALCISVAKYLEKEFGGHIPACKVK